MRGWRLSMAIPTLMWFDDPRVFLSANWTEITQLITEQCRKCKAYPAVEHEDDVRFIVIDKIMRGVIKYDPLRSPLTNFLHKVIYWSIQKVFLDRRKVHELVPLEEAFSVEQEEDLDVEIDVRSFLRKFIERGKHKRFDRLALLKLKAEGYKNREIAKKLRISKCSISMTLTELREKFTTMNQIKGVCV
jgi:hypothetical protein